MRDEDIALAWASGAFELPAVARRLTVAGKFAAIVCVGAAIKGETQHDEVVRETAAPGIAEVARDTGVPCTFGVIWALNRPKAEERSGAEVNRGAEAAPEVEDPFIKLI